MKSSETLVAILPLSWSDRCRAPHLAGSHYAIPATNPQTLGIAVREFVLERARDNAKPLWWFDTETSTVFGEVEIFGQRFVAEITVFRWMTKKERTDSSKHVFRECFRLQRELERRVTRFVMYGELE